MWDFARWYARARMHASNGASDLLIIIMFRDYYYAFEQIC